MRSGDRVEGWGERKQEDEMRRKRGTERKMRESRRY